MRGFYESSITKCQLSNDAHRRDPYHAVTLVWAGADGLALESGPFHSSPGAGVVGHNCDIVAESHRSGSKCTPKGQFTVEGFAACLNDDSSAVHVTYFNEARGIALHYYPVVPNYPASHGCVRLQSKEAAQLIHDNAIAGTTVVIVGGTWTRPPHQWPH